MLVALMLVAAGLQYIVKRKALPFTRNWLMGAVVFELLLSLWHVIFTNPGEEFVPPALRAGGGLFGAVPAAFLRSWFGGFGAVFGSYRRPHRYGYDLEESFSFQTRRLCSGGDG